LLGLTDDRNARDVMPRYNNRSPNKIVLDSLPSNPYGGNKALKQRPQPASQVSPLDYSNQTGIGLDNRGNFLDNNDFN